MTVHTPYRLTSSYLTTLTIFVSDRKKALLATYSLIGSYLSTTNTPVPGYRWLREGTVLAHDGEHCYPNPSGNASGNEVGVLEDRVLFDDRLGDAYNPICTVVLADAWMNSNVLTDGGTFGSVQANTVANLRSRNIHFIAGSRV